MAAKPLLARLDHAVLTVADLDRTIDFYVGILGLSKVTFGDGRMALAFGEQKLNLHLAGHELEPKAAAPTPGSADLCFVIAVALAEVIARLDAAGIPIEEGPVPRTGALGPITSIYVRDPDHNLIELSTYDTE